MFIDDINQLKSLIHNNIQLFRLHNFISANYHDRCVADVANRSNFNRALLVWMTEINSLYSSISLIHQFIKNQGHSPNDLDPQFNFTNWFIIDSFEADIGGNRFVDTPDLDTILRRMRNSVSHGSFELNTNFERGSDFEIIFYDKNDRNPNSPRYKFQLSLKALNLSLFLEKLERKFNTKY